MPDQLELFNPDLQPIRYIAAHGEFEFTLDERLKTFWLSQKHIAGLFNLDVSTISEHIANFRAIRGSEADATIRKFRIVQREGNRDVQREIEHYNHNIVIYIGYRAQATDETIRFQRTVEEVFRQRLEQEHARAIQKANHARAADVTGYILAGFSPSHAEKRVNIKSTFKKLSALLIELADAKMIGAVVSREYLLMFGKAADELKIILRTKTIRDALPEMQLSYLDMIEQSLIMVLSRKDRMTREEILDITERTIRPLAAHLKTICEMAGVDVITNKPSLGSGAK